MAGKRMLYDTSRSEKLAAVSYPAAVLWFAMLPLTDVHGNLEADPRIVKGTALPLRDDATPEKIGEWLNELADAKSNGSPYGLIAFYEDRGKRFLHFIGFKKYQVFNRGRAPKPEWPDHPVEFDKDAPGEPELFEKPAEPTAEKKLEPVIIPSAPLSFAGRLMKLTEEEHAAIKARFPEFLEPELRVIYKKIDDWCAKNGKRGQKKDWYKTVTNWLEREEPPRRNQKVTAPLPEGSVQRQIEEERKRRMAL